MIKKYLLLASLFLMRPVFGQENRYEIPDTLQTKSYDYLFDRIEETESNSGKQTLYLQSFLSKAKSEKNYKELVNGYKNYVYHSSEKLKLVYTDSMIYTAKKSSDNSLIGAAYLSKGIIYYAQKKHNKALDNYLTANDFISKTNDKYLIYKVKYNISNIKYYLGFYQEAISLFRECIDYFKANNTQGYLNSLHSLGLCYNQIGNYGSCTEINEKGILEGERLENNDMAAYFINSEGINQYFKNNYDVAIKKIIHSLPAIIKNHDFANESVGYFYIGKSYWKLNKPSIALIYLKKVDRIFVQKGYIRPDLIETYQLLIAYYKSKNNLKSQLYYIEQLLKADRLLHHKFKYLFLKIHKEYDTRQLLIEKIKIENTLEHRKHNDIIFTSVIIVLFLFLLLSAYRHITNRKIYKKKFDEIMAKSKSKSKVESKSTTNTIKDINQDTLTSVLKQLEKFEKDKKFLEKDSTTAKLTVAFGSNVKYLSKIIYHSRGKKFVNYINDLKVDYLITLMKEDKIIRNYTNKALAEEVGFSSTQRFSNAFFARTGMPPSYFIEELKKEQSIISKDKM